MKAMTARMDSMCPICNERIEAFVDLVIRTSDDEWVHIDCAPGTCRLASTHIYGPRQP